MRNLIDLLLIGLGIQIGLYYRKLENLSREILVKLKPEEKPSITMGAYKPAKEYNSSAVIAEPKSPQLIEWENQQKLDDENKLHIRP